MRSSCRTNMSRAVIEIAAELHLELFGIGVAAEK